MVMYRILLADPDASLLALHRAFLARHGYEVETCSDGLGCLDLLRTARLPLTAKNLADRIGLTGGAITGVVDRLERAGLARRKRDAEDRRKVLVEATEAAAGRVLPFFEPMERRAMAALAPYGEAELALLLDFMRRARDAASAAMAELQAMPEPEAPADARRRLRG